MMSDEKQEKASALKKYTPAQLVEIVAQHRLWLWREGGERADLSYSDLSHRDLSHSDLRNVDLSHSDLSYSDLSHSDFRGSALCYSDFRGSDFRDSDLGGSDLGGSNLGGSDLSGSDLDFSAWPLWCGSLGVKCGHRLFSQLLYHLASLDVSDADEKTQAAMAAIRALSGVDDFHDAYHTELDSINQEG